jgi:hypothetical protein
MTAPAAESAPMREIRRRLRELPRERRKEIASSIRNGRAVRDPRDARLAVAWAETLEAKARRVPWWLLPLSRPHGWRAWLWIVHFVWLAAAIAYAYVGIWPVLPNVWRWVALGFLAYSAVAMPFTFRLILRTYWNAPDAARQNRELPSDGGQS